MADPDYIYSNIMISNEKTTSIPIEYDEIRSNRILEKGSDYNSSIIRFSIPIHQLPIFIFKQNIYGFQLNNNPVTLLNDFTSSETSVSSYVLNHQAWIDYLNTKFTAFALMFRLVVVNDRLVCLVDKAFVATMAGGARTQPANFMYFTPQLYTHFFSGFPAVYDSTKNLYRLDIVTRMNQYNAGGYINSDTQLPDPNEYFHFKDTWNSLEAWNVIRRIIVTTNSIQLNSETLSTSVQHDTNTKVNSGDVINILTDYEIPFTGAIVDKTYLFYQPSEYRYQSIITDGVIQKLNLKIYFTDNNNNVYPLFMNSGTDCYIKILFKRKTVT